MGHSAARLYVVTAPSAVEPSNLLDSPMKRCGSPVFVVQGMSAAAYAAFVSLLQEYNGALKVVKVEHDTNKALVERYKVCKNIAPASNEVCLFQLRQSSSSGSWE